MAHSQKLKFFSAFLLISAFSIALPLLLHLESFARLVTNFHGEAYELLELFGFSASLGLLTWAIVEGRLRRPVSWRGWLPIWLTVFVGLLWLAILIETSTTAGDYPCYQNAAVAVGSNKTPYRGCYFYPPLMAQAMAFLSQSIVLLGAVFGKQLSSTTTWQVVFYLFQCLQWYLILVSFRLSLVLTQALRLRKLLSLLLVTGLFILNVPLLRTVMLHQVNLWILASVLGIILLLDRRPFLAGILTAFSGHIKIYPLIFSLPFIAGRHWRAVLGLVTGLAAFALLPASLGYRWTIWQQFFQFFLRFPQYNAPRNNSLYSLVANLLLLAGADVTDQASMWRHAPRIGYYLLVILMAAWLAWRFFHSRRILNGPSINGERRQLLFRYCFLMDMVAAQLLISPSLWEHQWVIIIPYVIWTVSFQDNLASYPRLGAALAAAMLVFAVPSFDLIPFSYVRIAGLLLMLWITSPGLVLAKPPPAPAPGAQGSVSPA